MATRGRKPKPTLLKVVTGNPGRRPLPENEPEFDGEVSPPDWVHESPLRAYFLAEWERVVRQLEAWGILGEVNQGAIEGLCTLYAQGVRAAVLGDTTEARQSFDGYRKALNEFGLTPASKGRVDTGQAKKPEGKAASYFGT